MLLVARPLDELGALLVTRCSLVDELIRRHNDLMPDRNGRSRRASPRPEERARMVAAAIAAGEFVCSLCGIALTNGPDLRDPRRAVVGHEVDVVNGGGRIDQGAGWRWECARCSSRGGQRITTARLFDEPATPRGSAEPEPPNETIEQPPPDLVEVLAGEVARAWCVDELERGAPPVEFVDRILGEVRELLDAVRSTQ